MVQPGVGYEQPAVPLRLIAGIAQADGSGPILAEQVDTLQIEAFEKRPLHGDVAVDLVPVLVGDLVATPEADVVVGDHAVAGVDQPGHPVSVQVRPIGFPVGQKKDIRFGRPSSM